MVGGGSFDHATLPLQQTRIRGRRGQGGNIETLNAFGGCLKWRGSSQRTGPG